MKVLLFASAREAAAGRGSVEVPLPGKGAMLGEVLEELVRGHPPLRRVLASCRFALNGAYLEDGGTRRLHNGDELAVLPPYSGG
jgi:molybdopterin converting factor small subunit